MLITMLKNIGMVVDATVLRDLYDKTIQEKAEQNEAHMP